MSIESITKSVSEFVSYTGKPEKLFEVVGRDFGSRLVIEYSGRTPSSVAKDFLKGLNLQAGPWRAIFCTCPSNASSRIDTNPDEN